MLSEQHNYEFNKSHQVDPQLAS